MYNEKNMKKEQKNDAKTDNSSLILKKKVDPNPASRA